MRRAPDRVVVLRAESLEAEPPQTARQPGQRRRRAFTHEAVCLARCGARTTHALKRGAILRLVEFDSVAKVLGLAAQDARRRVLDRRPDDKIGERVTIPVELELVAVPTFEDRLGDHPGQPIAGQTQRLEVAEFGEAGG